jgi:hydrogenase expression/formation protein HypE
MGADPIALTSNFIIEEGFKFKKLKRIVKSFNLKAKEAGIAIIAGDTKVMPRGTLSGIIISTSGIGLRDKSIKIADNQIRNGDKIILSGTIGDHGIALMAAREELSFTSDIQSDVSLLTEIFKKLKPNIRKNHIHAMKDPTRGGIAGSLNDWAKKNNVSIWVKEEKIPIKKQVRAVSDMLGLDPFNIACEGKVLLAVDPDHAKQVLNLIKATSLGKEAEIIGEVRKDNPKKVLLETIVGGTRFVDMPLGEPIPRIC